MTRKPDLITPIILCGGQGARLWPVSRPPLPKQFAKLHGPLSLFQQTLLRFKGHDFAPPILVTHADLRYVLARQLAEVEVEAGDILLEPESRNTAASVMAGMAARDQAGDEHLFLVTPSDHVVGSQKALIQAMTVGRTAAGDGEIVTFGVVPDRAETGYGYLEVASGAPRQNAAVPLKRFVEKPDAERAKAFFASGDYLWNAGLFLFSKSTLESAARAHAPETFAGVGLAVREGRAGYGGYELDPQAWGDLPSISVDYAIMEKAARLSVVPLEASWSDLGDWRAVAALHEGGADGVVCRGAARAEGSKNCYLHAEADAPPVLAVGAKNLVTVATKDAVLVADKSRAQDVKKVVAVLEAQGATQTKSFSRDLRPWGWFESISRGPRFQVKRISVYPGRRLSLQKHLHRSEHWVIVQGLARVTLGVETTDYKAGQSIFIPLGAVHRVENPGLDPLVLIEVQTGSYLEEDDIIRLEDDFERGGLRSAQPQDAHAAKA